MQYNNELELWEQRIWATMPPPATGMLLVANPFMVDPNFTRTVLLLVSHSEAEGSLGYVLSRPLDAQLAEVAPQLAGFAAPLQQGGPVELNTLHFVHRAGQVVPDAQAVCEDIYWSGDFDRLAWLASTAQIRPTDFRFFLGYSGWGAGQLAHEQTHRSWLVCPATPRLVFDVAPQQVWTQTIRHMGGDAAAMANFPENPQLN